MTKGGREGGECIASGGYGPRKKGGRFETRGSTRCWGVKKRRKNTFYNTADKKRFFDCSGLKKGRLKK